MIKKKNFGDLKMGHILDRICVSERHDFSR